MNHLSQLQSQAINAAKTQNWKKAATINLKILKEKPKDVQGLNRLGVAYLQLNKKGNAKRSFKKVLVIDQNNPIAKKYLNKLKTNQTVKLPTFCSQEFIEEPGKTKNVPLHRLACKKILNNLNVGQECQLKSKSRYISVEVDELYLGALPEDLSFRLTTLIKNGNEYSCLVKSIHDKSCTVFIKETYRSKKNTNTHSFMVNNSTSKSSGPSFQLDDSLLRQKDIPVTIVNTDDEVDPGRKVTNLVNL